MNKKIYEAPGAETILFAAQEAITASEIQATAGFNWDDTKWITHS